MVFLFVVRILRKSREYTLPVSKNILEVLLRTLINVLLDATVAGAIAVLITSSPLTVIEGERAVITYLISLVNKSLNVTSSIKVQHDFDGDLSVIVNDCGNDCYDIVFPPVHYGFSVVIVFNRTVISNQRIELDVERTYVIV